MGHPGMPEMEQFDGLMGTLEYPMFIVTVRDGGERAGCLVGFATQSSIHPSRFLACLSEENHTFRVAQGASHLAVHVVPESAGDLAALFGGETGDEIDKFARCSWHEGPEGLPILDDCDSWFVGRVLELTPLGDHVGFLLDPVAVHQGTEGRQLTSQQAAGIDAGHEA
jgi:flavin reductase (DIM6/NTAB) family NADH-FMN oxidoreductase RutF